MADHLGIARPAAGGLGIFKGEQILRNDHSDALWRLGFLGLCSFRSHPKAFHALALGRGHRDGAEFARARRAAASLWNQGAAGLLAAAAGGSNGDSLLRP